MLFNYLIPRVTIIPPGYNCTAHYVRASDIANRLPGGNAQLSIGMRVFHEGEMVHEIKHLAEMRNGELVTPIPQRYTWNAGKHDWNGQPGFMEDDIRIADGTPMFNTKYNQPTYVQNWVAGQKSILTNLAAKFADPRVLGWLSIDDRFIDTCSTIWLDRDRDYGESIFFLNPFLQPIVAKINTEDGRSIRGIRIPPLSVRSADLQPLLKDTDRSWRGQIQITANNRALTTNCKHSLSDPSHITDLEHLDPYRSDVTHIPVSQLLRRRLGRAR